MQVRIAIPQMTFIVVTTYYYATGLEPARNEAGSMISG